MKFLGLFSLEWRCSLSANLKLNEFFPAYHHQRPLSSVVLSCVNMIEIRKFSSLIHHQSNLEEDHVS